MTAVDQTTDVDVAALRAEHRMGMMFYTDAKGRQQSLPWCYGCVHRGACRIAPVLDRLEQAEAGLAAAREENAELRAALEHDEIHEAFMSSRERNP